MNNKEKKRQQKQKEAQARKLSWAISHYDCFDLEDAKKKAEFNGELNRLLRECGILFDQNLSKFNCEAEYDHEMVQTAINDILTLCKINHDEKVVVLTLNEREAFTCLASLEYAFAGVEATNEAMLDDDGFDIIKPNGVPGVPLQEGEDQPIKDRLMEIFPDWKK